MTEDVAYLPGSVRDGAHLSHMYVTPQALPRRTPESDAARRAAVRVLRALLKPETVRA